MTDQEFEKVSTEPGAPEPEETDRPEAVAEPGDEVKSGDVKEPGEVVEPGDNVKISEPGSEPVKEPGAQQEEAVKPAVQEMSRRTVDYRQYNYQQNSQYQSQQNGQYDYGNTGYHADYSRETRPGEEGMDTRPLSMGEWALTLLALLIPCCGGIILYIFWAFSKKGNINRRNFCRAALIVLAGVAVIYFLVMSIIGGAVFSYVQHYGMY